MKNKSNIMNSMIILISICITIIFLELSVRISKKQYRWQNYLIEHLSLFRSAYPAQYDANLGWIPKPGYSGTKNAWGTKVVIIEHGIRSNGPDSVLSKRDSSPVILAVGDSFTFGDQVSDQETWPAILENLMKSKVINGGVFAYGLDQTFLRAKSLIPIYRPNILIVSFILEDFDRCGLSERSSAAKPYFDISQDNKLVLRNVPVPQLDHREVDMFRRIFGYSALMHQLIIRLAPEYWLEGVWTKKKVHTLKESDQIACQLLRQIDDVANENQVSDVYILVQYFNKNTPKDIERIQRALQCIDTQEVHVIDLKQSLDKLKASNRKEYESFFNGHLTYAGNRFVAEQVNDSIVKNFK